MLRGLLFDFDGTILDSEDGIHAAWTRVFAEHGASFTEAEWSTLIGATREDPNAWDPVAALQERATRPVDMPTVRARIREEHLANTPHEPLPGVRELVEEAVAADIHLGIGTSSVGWWSQHFLPLTGLDEHFDVLVSRDDVGGVTKPAPDIFNEAIRRMSQVAMIVGEQPLMRAQVVVIEDSPNGIRAAKAAGCKVVAVPTGLTRDRVAAEEPDLLVHSLTEVTLADLRSLVDD